MAFGTAYHSQTKDFHFGAVSEAQLATLQVSDNELRYLGDRFRQYLQNPDQLLEYLAAPRTLSWGISVGEQLAGVALIHVGVTEPYVRTVIDARFQGQGLAKFAHAIRMSEWFLKGGADSLRAYSHPANERSISNIASRGYYKVEQAADRATSFDGYRAVNPYVWEAYHRESAHPLATPDARQRVLATMSLMDDLVSHNPVAHG